MLIGSLKYGTWKTVNNTRQFNSSKKYGHFDAIAALVYMVRNIDIHTNPVPRTHNYDPYTQYMPVKPKEAPSAELNKLANALQPKKRYAFD
jgi:hypothetical protein